MILQKTIRKLTPNVIGKIAAGEVVERPASAVKELVENALDAGTTQIAVEIARGGLDVIRVADDGCGIPPAEMALAFERHATSKLSSEADLERIGTLGFRGEALPSIAAVADVEMRSRPLTEDSGRILLLREGEAIEERSEGMATGTVVTARGLFRRQPARLNFLRSPATEAGQVAQVVSHYALAYPEVRFTLLVDGRLTLQTPGDGDLQSAAAGVYGHQVAAEMLALPLDGVTGDFGYQTLSLTGLISSPGLSRANRNYMTLFINRRWVRSRSLTYAIEEAYHGLLMTGRYPLAVVDLRLPPDDVDVNVHPAKVEVRLRRERDIFRVLQREVRRVLSSRSPVPFLSTGAWSEGSPVAQTSSLRRDEGVALAFQRLDAATSPAPEQARLTPPVPALRALGQVGMIYVVAEGPEGLYLVDQHAAHERVLFEQLLDREEPPERQGLLEPLPVELTPLQSALLVEMAAELEEQGFSLEPFGGQTYLIRSIPAVLKEKDVARTVLGVLDTLGQDEAVPDRRERVAMSLACHGAIRAGQSLTPDEMRELLRRLEATRSPRTCPHGRPTMIHMSADALAREFRRR